MTDQTRYPAQRGNGSSQMRPSAEGRFSRRAEDPLAELARLIGQDDPFAELSAEQRQPAPPRSLATPVARRPLNTNTNGNGAANPPPRAAAPAREPVREPVQPPVREPVQETAYEYEEEARYDLPADDYDQPAEPVHGREAYDSEEDDGYGYQVPAARRPTVPAPQSNGRAYSYGGAPAARADARRPQPAVARQPQPAPEPDYYEEDYAEPQYDNNRAGREQAAHRDARAPQAPEYQQYEDGPYEQEYAQDYEAEYAADDYLQEEYVQPKSNRRWMLLGIMSLAGLVVLGVAGVYGYRAVFKRHAAGNPPTIRSAETPTKVAPSATAQPEGSKQNYDRIGEPAGGERVVSREEQPAFDPNSGTRSVTTTPIGQPGGSVSAFASPSQPAPALTAPSGSINQGTSEPRRVKTMTIRSDGSVADGSRSSSHSANAPLALSPTAEPQNAEPAVRTARAPVPSQPSYGPPGSYVVQVSSQKTEADAQTAWQQLQARYTNVLGNAQVSFKRVDLGDRGTFYRAMVGPYANRDQAYEICQNLKAAGGECVVQRN